MGSRKRVKPNPAAAESNSSSASAPPPSAMPSQSPPKPSLSRTSVATEASSSATPSTSQASEPNGSGGGTSTLAQKSKQVHKTKSWYGSWPRVPKSAASTQVARETILGGTSKPKGTADFSRFESRKPSDAASIREAAATSPIMPKVQEDRAIGGAQPDPAPPIAAETTKPEDKTNTEDGDTKMTDDSQNEQAVPPSAELATDSPAKQEAPAEPATQRPASGWFGWFGKPPTAEPAPSAAASIAEPPAQEAPPHAAAETQPPESKASRPEEEVHQEQGTPMAVDIPNNAPAQEKAAASYASSWLWSWSGRDAPTSSQPEAAPPTTEPEAAHPPVQETQDVVMQEAPAVTQTPEPPAPTPKAGSTWAFWSRDTGSTSGKSPAQQGEQGQLAVVGENSEAQPKRANSMDFKAPPAKEPPLKAGRKEEQAKTGATPSRESSSKSSKRARPQSMEVDDAIPGRPNTPKAEATKPVTKSTPKTPTATAKVLPPNIVLPSFSGTYKLKDNPSIIKQIAQLLLRTQQPAAKHVYLTKEPPKIKKAIAIGVHGLFPANYLRPMIGQPTGTSIKFANHCADAIRRWADSHGCEDCEIEKVALEGEGRIGERVENLWKLLLNWIDQIRTAELILIACHSQGVPVSIMLLAKLIEFGIVTSARVGVCAMAGVSLGPFPDYRSSMGILMGSAAELWEFADPQSEVSRRLEASIKTVLSHGARITYVGSIDDQLVPLESAIYAPAHHPYIFRAVFIDGRIHAPDFIAHLVGFALKLRNLGVSDHGLIRELSVPLAGSLYSGEGHSRLYDERQVYDLAVTHALETTDVAGPAPPVCEVRHLYRDPPGSSNGNGNGTNSGDGKGGGAATIPPLSNPNPYHLPWIMRGVLEEDFVKTELSAETAELVRQFDDWKPVTKALKDVKYRLEAVRSKL